MSLAHILEADSGKLYAAVAGILSERGLITPAEITERMAVTDRASPELGAAMVARAWTDPAYRRLMIEDGTAAAEEAGVMMRGLPPLGVLENTPGIHNVVVCTLCSGAGTAPGTSTATCTTCSPTRCPG